MNRSCLSVLALCVIAAPLLYGCDNHKRKSSSSTVNAGSAGTSSTSSAPADDGNAHYAVEKMEKEFDVAGFKLGMTQAEAQAKLSAEHWNGKFGSMPDNGEEYRVDGFILDDKAVALFRHVTASGDLKIHFISFQQTYTLAHDWHEVAAALEKKYGKASKVIDNGDSARLEWTPKPLTTTSMCNDIHQCSPEEKADMETQAKFPLLRADISKKEVEIKLISKRLLESDMEAAKAVQGSKTLQQMKENGKKEKVQF